MAIRNKKYHGCLNTFTIIDDLGLESFTESFRDWIYNNATDTGWFEDALRESQEFYVEDIEEETYGQDKYANRLIEELVDAGILDDEDLVPEDEEDEDPYETALAKNPYA